MSWATSPACLSWEIVGNQLTGGIPAELGGLASLTVLSLQENQLTGEIPAELGGLANLTSLNLYGNALTGELPLGLARLTALERFLFFNNPSLCAPIDDAFQAWLEGMGHVHGSSCAPSDSPGDRAVLVQFYNAMDGDSWTNNARWLSDRPIREWHGVTSDAGGGVKGLYLWSNELSGEIPPELGSLANLETLDLRDNELTGTIPQELGTLSNLDWLYLSQNLLTGCIPTGLERVTDNDLSELGLPFCVVEFPAGETGARSVDENTGAGTPIGGPVEATNSNNDTLTYSLCGTDAASFDIDTTTGQLMTKVYLDYEERASYSVTVTATEPGGESATQSVTITVTDVDEAPVLSGNADHHIHHRRNRPGGNVHGDGPGGRDSHLGPVRR